jgi:hypothetical protein
LALEEAAKLVVAETVLGIAMVLVLFGYLKFEVYRRAPGVVFQLGDPKEAVVMLLAY